jgi:hypothetical protein
MRLLRSSVLVLMLSLAAAASFAPAARAQISIDVRVDIPPPPLPYYEQPVIPAEGYLWVPGFWAWDEAEADYYWVPGTWVEPPQPGLLWTPAYWGWVDGRYVFFPGYWAPEVGFYGGIDYGYGYSGDGYYGGRWDHGAFFYNREVNNVASVRITNVYSQTVTVNNRTSNVSFNGGNGGTTARPTPQQQAIARERHVEATAVQRQQVLTASKERASFSRQNHGEPAVAATPRAGVFQGAGVSHGSRTPVAAGPGNEPASNRVEPRSGEPPRSAPQPGQVPPRPGETQAPKAAPAGEPPKAEQQRRPVEEPSRVEEQRRPEGPRPEERRPAQQPRIEEPRRAAPPASPMPRAEEPRAPAAQPHEMRQAPPAARPAPGARPPAEERR